MQNPSPSPTVLSFHPLKTHSHLAKGPRNLNFWPGDNSVTDLYSHALGRPPHSLDSLEKDWR